MSRKILTLCIIHDHPKVLLGMKKKGFGMGRFNGFGGKVEDGESIEEATRREVFEECGLEVSDLVKHGVIDFEFEKDPGNILEVHVFKARDFTGEITESEEMRPEWFHIDEIPFKKMWPDDIYWIPLFLKNKKFKGKFLFGQGDSVLEHDLEEVDEIK